jgi:hypothetical protein
LRWRERKEEEEKKRRLSNLTTFIVDSKNKKTQPLPPTAITFGKRKRGTKMQKCKNKTLYMVQNTCPVPL